MRLSTAAIEVLVVALVVLGASAVIQGDDQKTAAACKVQTVNLELSDVPIAQAIDKLFQQSGFKYSIGPGVSGRVVELTLKGVSFQQALDALMEAARLTYRVDDGVYVICAAGSTVAPAPAPMVTYSPPPQAEQPTQPETATGSAAVPEEGQGRPRAQQAPGPSQVMINDNRSPVFYGQPAAQAPCCGGGYGWGGGPFQNGSLSIYPGIPGVVTAGANPYIIERGMLPPPPEGYVSPDVLRFLRGQWATQLRTFIYPYSSIPY